MPGKKNISPETRRKKSRVVEEPRNLRQQQSDDTRRRLLDSSLQLFVHKGFAGTTVRDIAKAAGVSPGLMFHYFPSKQAILQEHVRVIRSGIDQMAQKIERGKRSSRDLHRDRANHPRFVPRKLLEESLPACQPGAVVRFHSPRGKKSRERHQFHSGEPAARHSRAAQATIQARRSARTGGCILGRVPGHRRGSDLEPECADSRP